MAQFSKPWRLVNASFRTLRRPLKRLSLAEDGSSAIILIRARVIPPRVT